MTKLEFSDILKYIFMCFTGLLSTMQGILKHVVNGAPGSAASVTLHTTDYSTHQHCRSGSWVEGISGSTPGRLGYTPHRTATTSIPTLFLQLRVSLNIASASSFR